MNTSSKSASKKNQIFDDVYKIDQSTNLHMIEVALDQYADIFNEWDPTPFKRRDLDPDLQHYLEECSNEIPFKYPVEICFIIPPGIRNKQLEEESCNGLKNSLISKRYFLSKEIKNINLRTLMFVAVGFLCLGVAKALTVGANLQSILLEGLAISGWVFLWEAISLFFFTNRELYHRYQTFKRLQAAPVIFRESTES
jgi:hypothetical protein